MVSRACAVVSDRLRFHFGAIQRESEALQVVLVHMWHCHVGAGFRLRHAMQTRQRNRVTVSLRVSGFWHWVINSAIALVS
eukprot:4257880-Amphidinium_carterae.1